MAWISLIVGGLLFYFIAKLEKKETSTRYLKQTMGTKMVSSMEHGNAINLNSLSDETLQQKSSRLVKNTHRQLGGGAVFKVIAVVSLLAALSIYINYSFVRGNPWLVLLVIEFVGLYFGYGWLQKRERSQFDEAFPDALNMLTSAIGTGESLMHAIIYVGNTMDCEVGKEFKLMGERMQMGESPDSVFRKACKRFPYPPFHFFIITMRANLQRGGQLKEVMTRLNRLMFDARAVDKKKYALTSEARASAKIVAAIPFIFLWLLQFLSPENYEFVMFDPAGRYILYYVLFSEFIGISIIWKLMKGVEA